MGGWGSVHLIAELDLEIMMATVTYKNQPAIDKTKGKIPLAGNSHVYRVKKRLWNDSIEDVLKSMFIGSTLHVCCGKSNLGDVRLDVDIENNPDIVCDAANMSDFVSDDSFDTVLYRDWETDRKSTRLNSSHSGESRMPSSA